MFGNGQHSRNAALGPPFPILPHDFLGTQTKMTDSDTFSLLNPFSASFHLPGCCFPVTSVSSASSLEVAVPHASFSTHSCSPSTHFFPGKCTCSHGDRNNHVLVQNSPIHRASPDCSRELHPCRCLPGVSTGIRQKHKELNTPLPAILPTPES